MSLVCRWYITTGYFTYIVCKFLTVRKTVRVRMLLGNSSLQSVFNISVFLSNMIASTDARRSFVANLVVSGHYARQCLALIVAAEARATAKFARFGYEDVQKHLSCGLYEKNKHDMLIAYKICKRDMAAALATHKEDMQSGGFPVNLSWYAQRYRHRTSVIGDRYENAIGQVNHEYTKSI